MSVQSIYSSVANAATNVNTVSKAAETNAEEVVSTVAEKTTGFDETAVIYEKSAEADTSVKVKNNNIGIDHDALVAQLKAEQEARQTQLTNIVKDMMMKQGQTFGLTDDMWSFLAKGDYTVSEDVKAQAQEDISENGYWGVEQTSDRILDFAKALSGGDVSKADELLEAFKEGFKQATGAWGQDLPEISQKTYEAVEEKFEAWKNESEKAAQTETAVENAITTA